VDGLSWNLAQHCIVHLLAVCKVRKLLPDGATSAAKLAPNFDIYLKFGRRFCALHFEHLNIMLHPYFSHIIVVVHFYKKIE